MNTTHKNQNGFTIIEILIVITVLVLLGFIGWKFVDSQQKDSKASTQINKELVLPNNLEGIKSIDEIITLAAPDLASRQVLAAELELENEGLVYSLVLSDKTVLVYDAKTGSKVQIKDSDDVETDADTPLPAGFKPAITLGAAVETAKLQRPGKVVEKVELEVEDGFVVYSVRFSDKGRVDVDATTGSVLRIREPGKPEVKLQDDDNDIDDDGAENGLDSDNDNDGIVDSDDNDDDNDGVTDSQDADDDNDGETDTVDVDDDNDVSSDSDTDSSDSGSGSGRN